MKKVCDKYIQPKAQYKVLIKPRILALWKSYHFYLILGLESLISDFYFPLQVRVLLHGAVIGSLIRRISIEEVSIEYVGCDRSDIVMDLIFDGSDIVVDLIFDGSDIVVDLIL